jgi:hypothetical protein
VPPEGVQRQVLIFAGGAGWGCVSSPDEPPEIWTGRTTLEVGWLVALCIKGFAPHRPLDLELIRPDGSGRLYRIASGSTAPDWSSFDWFWQTRSTDQLGAYTVTATQGERRAQRTFTLIAASQPRLWAVPDYELAPGSAAEIHIAGYPPGTALMLHVYRSGGTGCAWGPNCVDYYTTLAPVTTQANGTAVITITTNPDDGAGQLYIVSDIDARAPGSAIRNLAVLRLEAPLPFPRTLRAGDSSPDVRKVQERLNALGYDEVGPNNGSFGPNTEAAVRSFQQRNRLEVTGVVDAITWERLFGPDGVGNR